MAGSISGEPFEKRFVELYSLVADASSLDQALSRLTDHTRDHLGAKSVESLVDKEPPTNADDVFSLAEPGVEMPWLHIVVAWGNNRRPKDTVLRSFRSSLALLMPFLSQRRKLDTAQEQIGDPKIGDLARPETSLEEPELKELLQKLIKKAIEDMGGDAGAVLLLEEHEEGLKLEPTAYVGPLTIDPHTLPRILKRRSKTGHRSAGTERRKKQAVNGIFFRVLDTRQPYRSGSLLDDPHHTPLFKESRSNLTVPLMLGGHPIGALLVEAGKRDAFNMEHEKAFLKFATTAGALISKTQAYEETRELGPGNTLRLFGLSTEVIARAHSNAKDSGALLLRGETGTGKEMLARYIHRISKFSEGAFVVAIDAAAISIEDAVGGSLFVEDADNLPQSAQEKLADLIENSNHTRFIISSSGGELEEPLKRALGHNEILLSPLRHYPDSITSLARLLLREVCETRGVPVKLLAAPTLEALLRYPFPKNLQELREVIEVAAAAADGPVVQPFHLPPKVIGRAEAGRARSYDSMQRDTEKAYLADLMARTRGDLARASSLSGLPESKLKTMLKKHQLKPADFAEAK